MLNQDWNVDDVTSGLLSDRRFQRAWVRLPWLLATISCTRTINSQWVFEGETFAEEANRVKSKKQRDEASVIKPLSLFPAGKFSYVLNQTDTPANELSWFPVDESTVVNFRNDYWTVTSGAGTLSTTKRTFTPTFHSTAPMTTLRMTAVAVPYGLGATENTASVSITRQLTRQMRPLLRYGYFNYRDSTFSGHNNYEAHFRFIQVFSFASNRKS